MLFFGGTGIERVYRDCKCTDDKYDDVKQKMVNHFKPKFGTKMNIRHFRDLYQFPGESFEEFIFRLKEKAKSCAFGNTEDNEIATQILHRCSSEKLKRKYLENDNNYTLEDLIKHRKLEESVNFQLQEFKKFNEQSVAKTEINQIKSSFFQKHIKNNAQVEIDKVEKIKDKLCFSCGGKHPHDSKCPAKGQECRKCGRLNHFAKCCKSKDKIKKHVRNVFEEEASDDNEGNVWRVIVKNVASTVKNWFMPMIALFVCGLNVNFTIDTGSEVNIIDEETFKRMKSKPRMHNSDLRLYGYGNNQCIKVLGAFRTRIKNKSEY